VSRRLFSSDRPANRKRHLQRLSRGGALPYLRSWSPVVPSIPTPFSTKKTKGHAVDLAVVLLALSCFAQDQAQRAPSPQAADQSSTVTIPAGTMLTLVLTHPVQSRVIHREDDIYAQISAPVTSRNQMVIPRGSS